MDIYEFLCNFVMDHPIIKKLQEIYPNCPFEINGSVIIIINNNTNDENALGQWRKLIHKLISNNIGWRSERGSKAMRRIEKCRYCKNELVEYQHYDCMCHWFHECGCKFGRGSKKGYGNCPMRRQNMYCKAIYERIYNAVLIYKTTDKTNHLLTFKEKLRNETHHLFRLAHLLLLANKYCTIDKHSDGNCVFSTIKLPREVLYRIIFFSFNGNKKLKEKFNWLLRRNDSNT